MTAVATELTAPMGCCSNRGVGLRLPAQYPATSGCGNDQSEPAIIYKVADTNIRRCTTVCHVCTVMQGRKAVSSVSLVQCTALCSRMRVSAGAHN